MFRLSVCTGTVLQDLPFDKRVKRVAELGFEVELWGWEDSALDAIAADSDITIAAVPGWGAGSMVNPEGVEVFLDGVEKNLAVAERLGCRMLNIGAGAIDETGRVVHQAPRHPGVLWMSAYKTLCRVAELAEKHDVVYNFEQLNTKTDHAGYPFPHVEDVVHLLEAVGSPRIRLLCDVYHVQIEQGNVIQTIRDYAKLVGHVHVADVPGRHEPGTGEINYPVVAETLRDVGYEGVVGLEAFPAGDDIQAMQRFREIFAV